MSAIESQPALEAEDVEQLPGFSVRFTLAETGEWLAVMGGAAEFGPREFGSGDSIEDALRDLLVSAWDSRESLRESRGAMSDDLECHLAYLESLPFLDAAVGEIDVHAVH